MIKHFFDDNWIKASRKAEGSWASEVLKNINGSGTTYLNCISRWFDEFPLSNKQKKYLKVSLKNFDNNVHLGAVNELSWWKLWTSRNFELNPIPTGKGSTPDFYFKLGKQCLIFEVTTLNQSEDEHCREINFSRNNSVRRIIAKAVKEKIKQIQYGYHKKVSAVLVLFNYDEWTGFGSQFNKSIKNKEFMSQMPNELSAVIYVEKFVLNGLPHLKKDSIVIAKNPSACFPLAVEIKSTFNSVFSNGEWINCDIALDEHASM